MTVTPPEREGTDPERGGQSPASPPGPQSPASPQSPTGPQSPAGPHSPSAPQSPAAGGGQEWPDAPTGGHYPAAPQPTGAPAGAGYPGPVPPGGWQQPMASAALPAGVELASWGSRVGAFLLDALVQLLIVVVCAVPGGILLGLDPGGALGITLLALGILAGFALALLVYPAFTVQRDGAHNGQTLGKQWVGIRAINVDGQPFQWGRALLREVAVKYILFQFVGGFFLSIPTLLDYLWPLWDEQNRALHDMLASSRVVRTRPGATLRW